MNEIFDGIGHVVNSLCGGVLILMLGWLGKIWAKRIIEKEMYSYKQELECLSKQLEKKNYVSKVKFDAEFDIYRTISINLSQFMETIGTLANEYNKFTDNNDDLIIAYNDCLLKYSITKKTIIANRPFIPHDIYQGFNNVCEDYKKICILIPFENLNKIDVKDSKDTLKKMIPLMGNCDNKADEIFDKIRIYLSQLDIQN